MNRMKAKHIHQLKPVVRERELAGRGVRAGGKVSSTSGLGQTRASGRERDNSTRQNHS